MRSFSKTLGLWLLLFLFYSSVFAQHDGGMWLLPMVEKFNAEDLKEKGLEIPLEQLGGQDGALTEAVVQFGKGCTASFISSTGLLLTNYHCAYSAIQDLDNAKRNLWVNGYWASNYKEELPASGLSVTVNRKILDISAEFAALCSKKPTKQEIISAEKQLEAKYRKQYPAPNRILMKSYNEHKIVTLYVQEQYNDVRLVGIAPKSVAKFGGETDNWMWPRHSGDFALFRVYTDVPGKSQTVDKVPLKPKKWLKVDTNGIYKGDFTMSMGFPMMSDRYSTSFQVNEKVTVLNPPMIIARKKVMDIYSQAMTASDIIRRQYQEKFAEMANYYKNAIGMNFWIDTLQTVRKKEQVEASWLQGTVDAAELKRRQDLYHNIQKSIQENASDMRALTYYGEATAACEVIRFISSFGKSYTELDKRPIADKSNLLSNISLYYNRFDMDVDRHITKEMMKLMIDSLSVDQLPKLFVEKGLTTYRAIDGFVDELYEKSIFADSAKLIAWVKKPSYSISSDVAVTFAEALSEKHRAVFQIAIPNNYSVNGLVGRYRTSATKNIDAPWYPDADKTIRLSYGKVDDLRLGGNIVKYYTAMDEMLVKAKSGKKDYELHPKLTQIIEGKQFRNYAVNGQMPVCFITEGDVTGGNSGSPMLNGKGDLIGLVFDCNWESMTREFNFDKELHRVICADIRYLLLLTEEFSGSKRILNEMDFVSVN
ncbi:S46 family peptidase [Sphingobacterium lumbrici]|uniref:S46 family peptidase n=1 Tax=Sphingobacterium lumbrici TaxID=2559600 RepID=UPI00112B21B2|nr:S46 family peptidase [Sphingobacterium lumbrici]